MKDAILSWFGILKMDGSALVLIQRGVKVETIMLMVAIVIFFIMVIRKGGR